MTNGYPNNNKNKKNNNKVKSKPLELFELAGNKKYYLGKNLKKLTLRRVASSSVEQLY
jgi:hypothetical protein